MLNSALGLLMLVGSYGNAADTTFNVYQFDSETGKVQSVQALNGLSNPSYLTVTDNGETVITVNENPDVTASVTMLKKEKGTNDFVPVATQLTGGADPCHVIVAPNGKYVVTANYSGGSISIIPFDSSNSTFGDATIMKFDGNGPIANRQQAPHPHFISFTPDNSAMVVDDLGTDCLHIFPLDSNGYPVLEEMRDVALSPGAGPRHLVYDTRGENAYIINELSGTVTHLRYNPTDKTLEPVSDILADYYNASGSADIHISPDGRFLYVSNRLKGDGIMTFAINETDGSLTSAGFTSTGKHPRNFSITPDGKWLLVACRDDNVIEVFSRNAEDGSLTRTDQNISCHRPVCIIFQPEQ